MTSWFRRSAPVFAAAGFALSIVAQSPPGFEVASIRAAVNDARGTSYDMYEGGLLRVTSVTLSGLIKSAWMLQSSQLEGPGWLDDDRYDIEAKSGYPERIDGAHLQPLLQNLLADRFALKFHWETRELPVYSLAVDKKGAILKENRDAPMTILNTRKGPGTVRIVGTKVTMEQLARSIGTELGRVVLDRTELQGGYDVNFEWTSEPAADSLSPSIFTALREQLGLKLESTKGPVKVLVVDSAQKASPN
jgi:uncharacterized protein (TIGR03435 family)